MTRIVTSPVLAAQPPCWHGPGAIVSYISALYRNVPTGLVRRIGMRGPSAPIDGAKGPRIPSEVRTDRAAAQMGRADGQMGRWPA
jgi:hypothetical protein